MTSTSSDVHKRAMVRKNEQSCLKTFCEIFDEMPAVAVLVVKLQKKRNGKATIELRTKLRRLMAVRYEGFF